MVDQHEGRVGEIDQEPGDPEPADEGERQEVAISEQQAVGGECAPQAAIGAVLFGSGLLQLRRQQDQPDEGGDHHRIEYAAPAVELDHRAAGQWRQDRRNAEDEHQERHQPCRLDAGVHVTDDGPWNDHAGSATNALQETEGDQRLDISRKRAADAGDGKETDAEIKRRLAAPDIRKRTVDQLRNGEGDEEREQAELHDAGFGSQVFADRRQGRQIHVDCEGTDR
ncbi:hypothetical protein D9M72_507540 [compost metagenome]